MAGADAEVAVVQVAPNDAGAEDVDMDDRARMRDFVMQLRRFQKQGVSPNSEEESDYFMRMPRPGRDPGNFDVDASQIVPITSATLPATIRTQFDPQSDGGGDVQLNPHGLVDGEQAALLNTTTDVLRARPALQNTDLHTDSVDVDTYLSTGAAARAAGFTATPGDEDLHPLLNPTDETVDRRQKHFIARECEGGTPVEIDTASSEAIEATLSQRDGPILGTPQRRDGIPGPIDPRQDVFTSSLVAKSEKDLLVGFLAARALLPNPGSLGWGAGGMKLFFDDRTPESLRASILGRVALVYPREVCPFFDMDGYVYEPPARSGYTVDWLRTLWRAHTDPTSADGEAAHREGMRRARMPPPLADYAVENAFAGEPDHAAMLDQFDSLVAPQPVMQLNIRPDTLSEAERPALEHNVNGFHKEQRLYPMPPALVKALLAAIEKHGLAHEFPMLMRLRGSRDKALLNVDGLRAGAVAHLAKVHSVESFLGFTSKQIKAIETCPTSAEEQRAWKDFLGECSFANFALTWVRRRSAFQPDGIRYASGEAGYTGRTGAVIEAGKPILWAERRSDYDSGPRPGEEGCDYAHALVPLLEDRPEDLNGRTLPAITPAGGSTLATFFAWASDAWAKNASSPPPYPTSVEQLKSRLNRRQDELQLAEAKIEQLTAQQTRLTRERDDARNALRALESRNVATGKSLVVANGGNARVLLSGPMATLDVYSKRGSLHCSTDASDEGYPIRVAKRARGGPLHQAVVAATGDASGDADAADLSVLRVAFFPSAAERDAQLSRANTSGW